MLVMPVGKIDSSEAALSSEAKDGIKIELGAENPNPLVYVFQGQGKNFVNAAKTFFKQNNVFKTALQESVQKFNSALKDRSIAIDLLDLVYPGQKQLQVDVDIYQPMIIFSIEYALVQCLKHRNIEPDIVIGHSDGEYAAAVCAKIINLDEAVELLVSRTELVYQKTKLGAMMSVSLSSEAVNQKLNVYKRGRAGCVIELAGINSDSHCVLSGSSADIREFHKSLLEEQITTFLLPCKHAFHSGLMKPIEKEFRKPAQKIKLKKPAAKFISSLTGTFIDEFDPNYWFLNISKPFNFKKAIHNLKKYKNVCLVELGVGEMLSAFSKASLPKSNIKYLSLIDSKSKNINMKGFNALAKFLDQRQRLRLSASPTISIEQAQTKRKGEPIAVVGTALRFPGEINSLEDYWELLRNKESGIGPMPQHRYHAYRYGKDFGRLPEDGGYLNDVYSFDPQFFDIPTREAAYIDPQHRMLLELVWEALENAGISVDQLREKPCRTGVCVGISTTDYTQMLAGAKKTSPYVATGNVTSAAPGRISMFLGLEGPSFAIDSACSSSLVAIDAMIRYLNAGECELAIVGAANFVLSQALNISLTEAGMLSLDGHSKVFDSRANGYVRSEGVGVVVLKRLHDAVKNGDNVYGVILGSTVGQDGMRPGLTVPQTGAQKNLMQKALQNAGTHPDEISFIEAHGTGTPLGDPIEINSIREVFSGRCPSSDVLHIRNSKAFIGHTETAAGMAGLFKALLFLQQNTILPNINIDTLNPKLGDLSTVPAEIDQSTAIKFVGRNRKALVNAFGFTGTLASVVVSSYEKQLLGVDAKEPEPPVAERPCHILLLSAKSEIALQALAKKYNKFLQNKTDDALANICYTSTIGRSHFDVRKAFVINKMAKLKTEVNLFCHGTPKPSVKLSRVVFLFTGQGSQYIGMGKELFQQQPVYRDAFNSCVKKFQAFLNKKSINDSLLEVVFSEDPADARINRTLFTQMALFANQYALTKLWQSWGVVPDCVIGHSIGEFCAALTAGLITLDDAISLVSDRAYQMECLPETGAMLAVTMTCDLLTEELSLFHNENSDESVTISALNHSHQTVLAGTKKSIDKLSLYLKEKGIEFNQLEVSRPFHSPLMEPMLDDFYSTAKKVNYRPAVREFISTVNPEIGAYKKLDAEYWRDQIVKPVKYQKAIEQLEVHENMAFLEIGPKPVLLGILARIYPDTLQSQLIPSLRKRLPNTVSLFIALSKLYMGGVKLNWLKVESSHESLRAKLALPTYAFQRKRYLVPEIEAPKGFDPDPKTHPLLGTQLYSPALDGQNIAIFQTDINARWPGFVKDHNVYGISVVPGAGYLSSMISAMKLLFPNAEEVILSDAKFLEPIAIQDNEAVTLQTLINNNENKTTSFKIVACKDYPPTASSGWTPHAEGVAEISSVQPNKRTIAIEHFKQRFNISADPAEVYRYLFKVGITYGDSFKCIKKIWIKEGELLGEFAESMGNRSKRWYLSPGLIDSFFQLSSGLFYKDAALQDAPFVPVALSGFSYSYPHFPAFSYIKKLDSSDRSIIKIAITLYTREGLEIGGFKEVVLKKAPKRLLFRSIGAKQQETDLLYKSTWKLLSLKEKNIEAEDHSITASSSQLSEPSSEKWLIFRPNNYQSFSNQLQKVIGLGHEYTFIEPGSEFFSNVNKDIIRIDPKNSEHFKSLLATYSKDAQLKVIYLWSHKKLQSIASDVSIEKDLVFSSQSVLYLVQALAEKFNINNQKIYFLTEQALPSFDRSSAAKLINLGQAALHGLCRTIVLEYPGFYCQHIDFSTHLSDEKRAQFFSEEIRVATGETPISYRHNGRHVMRLRPYVPEDIFALPFVNDYEIKGQSKVKGFKAFESLYINEISEEPGLQPNEVLVKVKYTSLNYRDVLNFLGLYPGDAGNAGLDFSGVIVKLGSDVQDFKIGDEIFGITQHGTLKSLSVVPSQGIAHKPKALDPVVAASLPVVFLTSYLCLETIAKVGPGCRVLIHGASGGVGTMAIQIVKYLGGTVFATTSKSKREFLISEYGIDPNYVMDSRSTEFGDDILRVTEGEGVDVVFNTLTADGFIEASLKALGQGGKFVEISKRNIWTQEKMTEARPDVEYHIFDLRETPLLTETRNVLKIAGELLIANKLSPPPISIWPIEKLIMASKYMANGRHIGKNVLKITDSLAFLEHSTYLITGGLGGIGFELCKRIIANGECHIVLVGRKKPSESQINYIKSINKLRARVHFVQADVSDETQVRELLATRIAKFPPLKGIFHAAGIIEDKLLPKQSWADFQKVFAPKLWGAWYLHKITTELDIVLSAFVLFSSFTSANGSPGQANYAAANSFLDGLAHYRHAAGLVAHSLNWGAWGKVGMAVEHIDYRRLAHIGMKAMSPPKALDVLESALKVPEPQLLVAKVNWAKLVKMQQKMKLWLSELISENVQHRVSSSSLLSSLKKCPNLTEQQKVLENYLINSIVDILCIEDDVGILEAEFSSLGLDSMSAHQLSLKLLDDLEGAIKFSPAEFISGSESGNNIKNLAETILKKLPESWLVKDQGGSSESALILPSQADICFFSNLMPESNMHHSIFVIHFKNSAKNMEDILKASLAELLSKQPTFKIKFSHEHGDKLRYGDKNNGLDFRKAAGADLEGQLRGLLSEPFNLSEKSLIRAVHLQAANQHSLIINVHKIIFDRFSMTIFVKQLANIFKSKLSSEDQSTVDLKPENYFTKLRILNARSKQPGYGARLAYWTGKLKDAPKITSFPSDHPRKRVRLPSIERFVFTIDELSNKQLRAFTEQNNVSLSAVGLAAFYLVLWKMSQQQKLVVGLPFSNRAISDQTSADFVGLFEDVLPLCMEIDPEKNLFDFVNAVNESYIEGQKNSNVDFSDIKGRISDKIDLSHHEVYQALFYFSDVALDFPAGFSVSPFHSYLGVGLDAALMLQADNQKIIATLNYDSSLFENSTIKSISNYFLKIVKDISTKSNSKLKELVELYKEKLPAEKYLLCNGYKLSKPSIETIINDFGFVTGSNIFIDTSLARPRLVACIGIGDIGLSVTELISAYEKRLDSLNAGLKDIVPLLKRRLLSGASSILSETDPVDKLLETMRNRNLSLGMRSGFSLLKAMVESLNNELSSEARSALLSNLKSLVSFSNLRSASTSTQSGSSNNISEASTVIASFANLVLKDKRQRLIDRLYAKFYELKIPVYSIPEEFLLFNKLPDTSQKSPSISVLRDISNQQISRYRVEVTIAGKFKLDNQDSSTVIEELHDLLTESYITPKKILIRRLFRIASDTLGRFCDDPYEDLFQNKVLSSEQIQRFYIEINRCFNTELRLEQIFGFANLNDLANYLERNALSAIQKIDPLIYINKPKAPSKHLFLVHPATGISHAYVSLKPYLPEDIAVYGINNLHLGDLEKCYTSVEEMAADYINVIREIQPVGPYFLGGWSFGGVVAFEMAQQLKRSKAAVNSVILFDTQFFNKSMFLGSGSNPNQPSLLSLLGIFALSGTDRKVQFELWHNILLIGAYRPKPYEGSVVFLKSQQVDESGAFSSTWESIDNGLNKFVTPLPAIVKTIPGDHYGVFYGEAAKNTAKIIKDILYGVQHPPILQNRSLEVIDRYLLFAAESNDLPILMHLIKNCKREINVNVQDFSGKTALHWAIKHDEVSLIKELLQAGADTSIKDFNGHSIDSLLKNKNPELLALAIKQLKKPPGKLRQRFSIFPSRKKQENSGDSEPVASSSGAHK